MISKERVYYEKKKTHELETELIGIICRLEEAELRKMSGLIDLAINADRLTLHTDSSVWSVNRTDLSKYIMGNKAHCAAVWQLSMPILKNKFMDISFIERSIHHEVHGYPNGKATHSFWE